MIPPEVMLNYPSPPLASAVLPPSFEQASARAAQLAYFVFGWTTERPQNTSDASPSHEPLRTQLSSPNYMHVEYAGLPRVTRFRRAGFRCAQSSRSAERQARRHPIGDIRSIIVTFANGCKVRLVLRDSRGFDDSASKSFAVFSERSPAVFACVVVTSLPLFVMGEAEACRLTHASNAAVSCSLRAGIASRIVRFHTSSPAVSGARHGYR